MNNLLDKNEKFKKNIDNVLNFMHFINQKEGNKPENVSSLYKDVMMSPVPYNATIISLYGNMELFIDEITEAYLDLLFDISDTYDDLPPQMKAKHESTTGEFLSNPKRFLNYALIKEDVVRNLSNCLTNNKNDCVNKKLLLRHGGNLKSEQIFEFYKNLGIENIKNYILTNKIFIEYYANKNELNYEDAKERLTSPTNDAETNMSVFKELDDLVEQRNQVAHSGCVDEKKSFGYIEENTIPFLIALSNTITEVLVNVLIGECEKKNKIVRFDQVYEVYNNRIILANRGDITLKLHDSICYECNGRYGYVKIKNIRVNNNDVACVKEEDPQDISIEIEGKVKKNWNFFVCNI